MATSINPIRYSPSVRLGSSVHPGMDKCAKKNDTWLSVQDWFPPHLQPQAQACWKKINETGAESSPTLQRAAFNKLKSLVYPGYVHFFTEEIRDPYLTTFSIQNEKGDEIVTAHWPGAALTETPSTRRALPHNPRYPFRLATMTNQAIPDNKSPDNTLPHINRLVVLGDSLSDSEGRMYQRSLGLIPSNSQYYEGNFTNGFVWTHFISSPDFLNKPLVNYAEGGSVSAHYSWFDKVSWLVSSMDKQMAQYKDPTPRDLVIIALGANDYMTFHKKNIEKVIDNQSENIERLLARGVKNIVVFGVPDLSLTPYAQNLKHSEQQRELHDICQIHNQRLSARMAQSQAQHPEATLAYFDVSKAFAPIYDRAKAIGYNVKEGVNRRGYVHLFGKEQELISDTRHLFNDDVHPTQEVHAIIAMQVADFVRQHVAPR